MMKISKSEEIKKDNRDTTKKTANKIRKIQKKKKIIQMLKI